MTTVSGELRTITNDPVLHKQVWVRARKIKSTTTGTLTDDVIKVPVTNRKN